ncbi:MAG: discoidin domain-containing protein [Planctomycetota bacterium]|jgi:hypothetical protein
MNSFAGKISLASLLLLPLLACLTTASRAGTPENLALLGKASASSSWPGFPPSSARDGDRYSTEKGKYWCGARNEEFWGWEIDFGEVKQVAKIHMVMGSNPSVRMFAPVDYSWQCSRDGRNWDDIQGASVTGERRLFRILTFDPARARYFRIRITAACNDAPSLREVEMYADRDADVNPAPWFYAIEIASTEKLPGPAKPLLTIPGRCPGWEGAQVHLVRAKDFLGTSLAVDPPPLCAFLGPSKDDWCSVKPSDFQGLEKVLKTGNLPLFGTRAGGQLLVILAAHGTSLPWVCPHCEWNRPKAFEKARKPFIYDHLKCEGKPKCGDFPCRRESGRFEVTPTEADPIFRFLPAPFHLREDRVGKIIDLPESWISIAESKRGAKAVDQILRVKGRPVYATQADLLGSGRDGLILIKNFLDGLETGMKSKPAPPVPAGAAPAKPGRRRGMGKPGGFAGVWWMDTKGVRNGHWNGILTLYRYGNLVGGYYLNANGVGTYTGMIGSDGKAQGEIWWEQKGTRGLWRFRYGVSPDGRALLGGSMDVDTKAFSAGNGIRIEGGAPFDEGEESGAPGVMDFDRFGNFTGWWNMKNELVDRGVTPPLLRLKHRGNVVWGYFANRKTGGFGWLMGVVGKNREFKGRCWWRENKAVTACDLKLTLHENAFSFEGFFRTSSTGEWKPFSGVSAN